MARFTARLEPIEGGTFVVIPAAVVEALRATGRTSVVGTIDGRPIRHQFMPYVFEGVGRQVVMAVNSVSMPMLLLSGILLPMALAPDWLRFLSTINPLTHAVDAARSLFNGQWGDPEIAIGVGITAVLAIISVWIAARTFARANA